MDDLLIQGGLVVGVTVGILLCASAVLAGAKDAIPGVPEGHPRVYVRAEDLPGVREKIELPEFQEAWERVWTSDRPVCKALAYCGVQSGGVVKSGIQEGVVSAFGSGTCD